MLLSTGNSNYFFKRLILFFWAIVPIAMNIFLCIAFLNRVYPSINWVELIPSVVIAFGVIFLIIVCLIGSNCDNFAAGVCIIGILIFIGVALYIILWVLLMVGVANVTYKSKHTDDGDVLLAWITILLYSFSSTVPLALCVIAKKYVSTNELAFNKKHLDQLIKNGLFDDIRDLELFTLSPKKWPASWFQIRNPRTGNTAWWDAFENKNYSRLKYLLSKGADVDQITTIKLKRGTHVEYVERTALSLAASKQYRIMVEFLLQNQADICKTSLAAFMWLSGNDYISLTSVGNFMMIVYQLIDRNDSKKLTVLLHYNHNHEHFDINTTCEYKGASSCPLLYSIQNKSIDMIKTLVEYPCTNTKQYFAYLLDRFCRFPRNRTSETELISQILRIFVTSTFFDARETFMKICRTQANDMVNMALLSLIEIMINCDCKYDDHNYIDVMDKYRANIDYFAPYCVSPLFFTLFNNCVDLTILLIDRYFLIHFPTFIVNDCDANGNTIFHHIINYNLQQKQIIEVYFKRYIHEKGTYLIQSKMLDNECETKRIEVSNKFVLNLQARFFLIIKNSKIDASIFEMNNDKGLNPFLIAMKNRNFTVLRELIINRSQLDVNRLFTQNFAYFMDSTMDGILTYLIMQHDNFNANKVFVKALSRVKNINFVFKMLRLMIRFSRFADIAQKNGRYSNIMNHFFMSIAEDLNVNFASLKVYHVSPLFFMLFNNRIDLTLELIENYYLHKVHYFNYVYDKDIYGNTIFDYFANAAFEKSRRITFRKCVSNLIACQMYAQYDNVDIATEDNTDEYLHIKFGKDIQINTEDEISLLYYKKSAVKARNLDRTVSLSYEM